MTTKIEVYNFALMNLGQRKLASLTEDRHPRYVLDDFYATVTAHCLAQAMWNFALRGSASLTQAAGSFGFTYAYTKPTDIIHPLMISETIGGQQLYNDYIDLGNKWYANVATLFCRYTSNDATSGGMLLSGWTEGFTAYVSAALSRRICLMVTSSKELYDRMERLEAEYYLAASSVDAVSRVVGKTSFNAEARNRLAESPELQGAQMMPFALDTISAARLRIQSRPEEQ